MNQEKLSDKKCVPCEGGLSPFSQELSIKYLDKLSSNWRFLPKHAYTKIHKKFKFKNFKYAMDFANKVAKIAESENHHPDLHISWGLCEVEISTHAIGGLSENDFILASKIDEIN